MLSCCVGPCLCSLRYGTQFEAAEIDRELISARCDGALGKVRSLCTVCSHTLGSFSLAHTSTTSSTPRRYAQDVPTDSPSPRPWQIPPPAGSIRLARRAPSSSGTCTPVGKYTHFTSLAQTKGAGSAAELTGHTDEAWALAVSLDGKYLASGGKDRWAGVCDVEKDEWVKGFGGQRDCISVSSYNSTPNDRFLTLRIHHRLSRRRCRPRRSSTPARTTNHSICPR